MRRALSPASWLKLAAPAYGRSDLAAEFYDREVFAGATYADVIARKRRPFVILNATDMTTGAQFPFMQDQFDLMCSDLAGVPLARAAASSSAFPGGADAAHVPELRRHLRLPPAGVGAARCGRSCLARQPAPHRARREPALARRPGAGAALPAPHRRRRRRQHRPARAAGGDRLVDHPWSVLHMMNRKEVNKLVVIVVNAATAPQTARDRSPTFRDSSTR